MFLVTGASSGIGQATAAALAARGIDVLAVARRRAPLLSLADQFGDCVKTVSADLSTSQGVDLVIEATTRYDRVDGVVHAAGSLVPVVSYEALTAADLTGHFRLHVATPIEINNHLKERLSGGRVVYIDSYSASAPRVGWSGYSIVKSAAQMAARAAAAELDGIDVVRVFPGGVRTPLVQAVLDSPSPSPTAAAFRELDRAGRLVEAADVGRYVARIALDTTRQHLADREFWDFDDRTTHDLLTAPPSTNE